MTGRTITPAVRSGRISLALGVLASTLVLALAGCGSSSPSKVSASSYVKSVCTTAATWYRSLESAGGHLQATLHKSSSAANAKTAYVAFIDALLHATQRAEQQLKGAGTPSVSGGKQISTQVVHAFDRAKQGLGSAASQVRNAPTSSVTAFEKAVASVQRTVQRSLQSMASLAPQKNRQLHAAALKEPACKQLRALG